MRGSAPDAYRGRRSGRGPRAARARGPEPRDRIARAAARTLPQVRALAAKDEDKPLDQAAIDALLQTTGKSGGRGRSAARKGGGTPGGPPSRPRPTGRAEPPEDEPEPGLAVAAPSPRRVPSASPRQVYESIS